MYEKITFLWFFELKLPKWDIFEAMNKESFVRLLTYLSIFLCNQSKLSTFAKLVKRVVPFLLRCNLFLIKEELFHVTIIYKTHAFAIA